MSLRYIPSLVEITCKNIVSICAEDKTKIPLFEEGLSGISTTLPLFAIDMRFPHQTTGSRSIKGNMIIKRVGNGAKLYNIATGKRLKVLTGKSVRHVMFDDKLDVIYVMYDKNDNNTVRIRSMDYNYQPLGLYLNIKSDDVVMETRIGCVRVKNAGVTTYYKYDGTILVMEKEVTDAGSLGFLDWYRKDDRITIKGVTYPFSSLKVNEDLLSFRSQDEYSVHGPNNCGAKYYFFTREGLVTVPVLYPREEFHGIFATYSGIARVFNPITGTEVLMKNVTSVNNRGVSYTIPSLIYVKHLHSLEIYSIEKINQYNAVQLTGVVTFREEDKWMLCLLSRPIVTVKINNEDKYRHYSPTGTEITYSIHGSNNCGAKYETLDTYSGFTCYDGQKLSLKRYLEMLK